MVSNSAQRVLPLTYAATIFVSAFLLFQIQPIFSKAILPWFGGTPAVWTLCLLCCQSLLFAGYAYAHCSHSLFSRRTQAWIHLMILVAAVVMLRVLPSAEAKPAGDADPTRAILVLLAATIGLPYFALSATGPLLQAWFARRFPIRSPYRLYALSNVGSLLALLTYPFVFEVACELPTQAWVWSTGFILFALLCGIVALADRPAANTDTAPSCPSSLPLPVEEIGHEDTLPIAKEAPPHLHPNAAAIHSAPTTPPWQHYVLWLLLPAMASVMLMATTNHVSTDVAVVPLLWIVPLALYLVTFIVAFDKPEWYHRTPVAALSLPVIYLTGLLTPRGVGTIKLYDCGVSGLCFRSLVEWLVIGQLSDQGTAISPTFHIGFVAAAGISFLAMFGICLMCHGELARLRPHTRYLTAYYLMMSAGGAVGGIAVSLVAPHVFSTILEWRLGLFAAAILAILFVLYALAHRAVLPPDPVGPRPITTLLARIALLLILTPFAFAILDLAEFLFSAQKNLVYQHRNFFGTLAIRERHASDPQNAALVLLNGTTMHGSQFTSDKRRGQPTSYYGATSGIGRVLNFYRRNRPPGGVRIADVGLGAGTLAAYATKGDFLTFYEINPAVVELATCGKWFTYVADSRARGANCEVKLGDARLTLERELRQSRLPKYHVLVLDAFSGDAVPTHLLTAEAYDIYLARLATAAGDGADGALIVHVSNRYLDLARVVRAAAEKFDLPCVELHSTQNEDELLAIADWIVLTRNKKLLATLKPFEFRTTAPPEAPILWTDSRSSLFEIVR
ncbi:MAG: hypothetical protein IT425_04165 [Pirellulales bacterium]|nr:hypothetical protein [Pirellulales bacterium]